MFFKPNKTCCTVHRGFLFPTVLPTVILRGTKHLLHESHDPILGRTCEMLLLLYVPSPKFELGLCLPYRQRDEHHQISCGPVRHP